MSDVEKMQWIAIAVLLLDTLVMRSKYNGLVRGTNKAVASHKEALMALDKQGTEHATALHELTRAFSRVSEMFVRERQEYDRRSADDGL